MRITVAVASRSPQAPLYKTPLPVLRLGHATAYPHPGCNAGGRRKVRLVRRYRYRSEVGQVITKPATPVLSGSATTDDATDDVDQGAPTPLVPAIALTWA